MSESVIRAQFDALRAQIDALEFMVVGSPAARDVVDCQHPEEKREPAPVTAAPRQFKCGECLRLVNPDAPQGQE